MTFALTVMAESAMSVPVFLALVVISLVALVACAVVVVVAEVRAMNAEENEQRAQVLLSTHPTKRRIVYVAEAIGLMVIVLAVGVFTIPGTVPHLTIIPCDSWGCWIDTIFW